MILRKTFAKFSLWQPAFLTLCLAIVLLSACKNDPAAKRTSSILRGSLVFLDSAQAANAILEDDAHFFDRITVLDMSLQMRRNYPPDTPRTTVLNEYQSFLRRDVKSFSPAEQAILMQVITELEALCGQLSPNLFPKSVQFIKTNGQHYGNGVYYTRKNRIIIPASELQTPNPRTLREVLAHELFHVYSRYHPAKRWQLYSLIGFEKLPDTLVLPPFIQSRLLLNPDGADFNYAIKLIIATGDTIQAAPILTANAPAYLTDRPNYFEYLRFGLYPIQKQPNFYRVLTDSLGQSPLRLNELPDFYRQITDNTFYIIHPDEILADNFKYLILAQTGEPGYRLSRFSEAGQELLQKIKTVLQAP